MIIEIELFIIILLLSLICLFFQSFREAWNNFITSEEKELEGGFKKIVRNMTDKSKVLKWEEPKDETKQASEEVLKKIIK